MAGDGTIKNVEGEGGGTKTKTKFNQKIYMRYCKQIRKKKYHALIANVIDLSWKKKKPAEGFACIKRKKINKQKAKKNFFKLIIASSPITYLNGTSPVLGGCTWYTAVGYRLMIPPNQNQWSIILNKNQYQLIDWYLKSKKNQSCILEWFSIFIYLQLLPVSRAKLEKYFFLVFY